MPKFLPHLGLDIGAKTIKLVQLKQESETKYSLSALGQLATSNGDKTEAIKKLIKEAKPTVSQAVIGLPESQVYTRVIEMPALEEPELTQAIKWQAEQYIPVPLDDVELKHQVIRKFTGGSASNPMMTVLLVAAPLNLLNEHLSIVQKAGLEVVSVETEILAVGRALVGQNLFSPTTLLVHFGSDNTTLAILSRGDLTLTQAISSGGAAMTRAIASAAGLDIPQAEEYQKTYGLDMSKLEGKVATAIKPVADIVIAEIQKSLAFYETRGGDDNVKRIVLSGGASLTPGLVTYFAEALPAEVQLGDPFINITVNDRQKPEVNDSAAIYTAAVGLALKLL